MSFEENLKLSAPIINTIITLGRLGIPFHVHCDDSNVI